MQSVLHDFVEIYFHIFNKKKARFDQPWFNVVKTINGENIQGVEDFLKVWDHSLEYRWLKEQYRVEELSGQTEVVV